MQKLIFTIFSSACLLVAQKVNADWPIGKGRTSIIGAYNYIYSSKFFDENGKVRSYALGDQFQGNIFGLTITHGLGRRLDFNTNIPFINQRFGSSGNEIKNSGIGDISFGFSYHFPSEEFQNYFTIKAQAIFPAYENNQQPILGYAQKGIMGAINYSFYPSQETFGVLEASYTRFLDFEEGPNQYRGSVAIGKSFNKYNTVTFNYIHQISQSFNKSFNPNPLANKNFSSGMFSMAYSRKLNRNITPYIQVFYTLYGKNVALGMGGNFYIIFRFP